MLPAAVLIRSTPVRSGLGRSEQRQERALVVPGRLPLLRPREPSVNVQETSNAATLVCVKIYGYYIAVGRCYQRRHARRPGTDRPGKST